MTAPADDLEKLQQDDLEKLQQLMDRSSRLIDLAEFTRDDRAENAFVHGALTGMVVRLLSEATGARKEREHLINLLEEARDCISAVSPAAYEVWLDAVDEVLNPA